jgi:hypothetical protein
MNNCKYASTANIFFQPQFVSRADFENASFALDAWTTQFETVQLQHQKQHTGQITFTQRTELFSIYRSNSNIVRDKTHYMVPRIMCRQLCNQHTLYIEDRIHPLIIVPNSREYFYRCVILSWFDRPDRMLFWICLYAFDVYAVLEVFDFRSFTALLNFILPYL